MQYDLLVPDYLNKGLDSATRRRFEEELAHNSNLQALVEQERAWSHAMKSEVRTPQRVDFSTFQARIEAKKFQLFEPIILTACAALVAVTLLLPLHNSTDVPSAENAVFETLTSSQIRYTDPAVRIVVATPEDLQQLLEEYQLSVLTHYSAALTVDVRAEGLSVSTLEAIASDPRILFIERLETQQP